MPDKSTVRKAREDLRAGKAPTTAAGEFVKQEFEHVRSGKHGARSRRQVVAIGLSKARRAGVPVKPQSKKTQSGSSQRAAKSARSGRARRQSR
ncbi:MAG: DUF6496 domain-containing protein [Terriglobales bacterium]